MTREYHEGYQQGYKDAKEEGKEPTTKNYLGVDCISRADAIKAMEDKAKKLTNEDTINGLCGAVAILYELPPVTPQEPRKGHWDIKDNMWWVCSACGCQTRMIKKYNVPNFCPACGADMREVEE